MPHLLPELSGQLALTMAEPTLVEDVEDASFEQLGVLAGPSPVRVSNSRLTLAGRRRTGLRLQRTIRRQPEQEVTVTTATLSLTALDGRRHAGRPPPQPRPTPSAQAGSRAVADALDANVTELVAIADSETSLGTARLTGEVARTTGQLRLFATVITEGSYLEAVIDHADPSATPPKPDLRRLLRPIGPVAVFSASNFPFAFSVAGGDTASALAVGCPVIVKAHSGHLRLSGRTAEIVTEALAAAGAPEGLFALVSGREAGTALVQDPAIKAVGFTGSIPGGRALFDLAVSRPDPIPFYGELGSLNPVVITAAALADACRRARRGPRGVLHPGRRPVLHQAGPGLHSGGHRLRRRSWRRRARTSRRRPCSPSRISDAYPDGLRSVASLPDVDRRRGGQRR